MNCDFGGQFVSALWVLDIVAFFSALTLSGQEDVTRGLFNGKIIQIPLRGSEEEKSFS